MAFYRNKGQGLVRGLGKLIISIAIVVIVLVSPRVVLANQICSGISDVVMKPEFLSWGEKNEPLFDEAQSGLIWISREIQPYINGSHNNLEKVASLNKGLDASMKKIQRALLVQQLFLTQYKYQRLVAEGSSSKKIEEAKHNFDRTRNRNCVLLSNLLEKMKDQY